MTRDGGGWTVFQRRQNGSEDFYRGWSEYKNGFGNLNGEFWLGLDKIHRLSKSGQDVLRVDLIDLNDAERYAKYGTFSVTDESDKYRLTVGHHSGECGSSIYYTQVSLRPDVGDYLFICSIHWSNFSQNKSFRFEMWDTRNFFFFFKGDARDSLAHHNQMQFSTKDSDNDLNSGNCATSGQGAWWYNYCYDSNLNGRYLSSLAWYGLNGDHNLMKKTEMKLRPSQF